MLWKAPFQLVLKTKIQGSIFLRLWQPLDLIIFFNFDESLSGMYTQQNVKSALFASARITWRMVELLFHYIYLCVLLCKYKYLLLCKCKYFVCFPQGFHITDSEEDLLRHHLAEIRRLRQRLEKLDVSKDPGQQFSITGKKCLFYI